MYTNVRNGQLTLVTDIASERCTILHTNLKPNRADANLRLGVQTLHFALVNPEPAVLIAHEPVQSVQQQFKLST